MATLISDELRSIADQVVHGCGYPSAVLSGLAPNAAHLRSGGFHCSIDDLIAHGNGGDYSNTRSNDRGWNPHYGAAFDVSLAKADMVRAYSRIRAVWADHTDPRRGYINAVNCWDGSGDATRFDFDAGVEKYASPDHAWHVHAEVHRRYVLDTRAVRAVVSMFAGEAKAAWIAREETPGPGGDDMAKLDPDDYVNIARAVANQKLGSTTVTVGAALQSMTNAVAVLAADAGKDPVDERALAQALLPLLGGGQLEAIIRNGMTVEERHALAARLAL